MFTKFVAVDREILYSKLFTNRHFYFLVTVESSNSASSAQTNRMWGGISFNTTMQISTAHVRHKLYIDKIYLLTAIGLNPGGSSTIHICTQKIHRRAQLIWEECGPCPVFVSYTLAFALQLTKKHGKTSVRVAQECQLSRGKQKIQNRTYITIRMHKHNNKYT